MWAMIVKEFRQLGRDRRTLAMMIAMPVILLIVFGYAASFDVSSIPTVAAGPQAASQASRLGKPFDVVTVATAEGLAWAKTQLRDGKAAVAVVTGPAGQRQPGSGAASGGTAGGVAASSGSGSGGTASGGTAVLIDGSQLFTARSALTALANLERAAAARPGGPGLAGTPRVTILYNPNLRTADVMVPGLAGVILVFIGTIITSLGVVRERQSGTLEQLAVMPLRPRDVFLGKIVPYFAVATGDLAIVIGVGVAVFKVPFRGSYAVFALGALLFLFVTLGLGVLISSVSQNQGQAIQLSVMVMLPQVLLSGLIFPLSSIAVGVRWISYILPLTYFTQISRGVMLRAEPIGPLWQPMLYLVLLGVVAMALATVRFRGYLAPSGAGRA